MTDIEKTIYTTLAYFSYFGYPLTVFELWKWQYLPARIFSLAEIILALKKSTWLSDRVACADGMYAIGNEQAVGCQLLARQERYADAIRKERKLKWALWYINRLPDVLATALCNNMPLHFTSKQSDIDIFIITKTKRVWSARLTTVTPLVILKQRPGEAKQDPIDSSFFVSEEALDLSVWRHKFDPYFAYWLAMLTPVYGERELWSKFFEKNSWAFVEIPNARPAIRAYRTRLNDNYKIPFFPISEDRARQIQEKKFPQDIKLRLNKDSCIVVSGDVLKFHKNDRRAEIARHMQSMICGIF